MDLSFLQPGSTAPDVEYFPFLNSLFFVPESQGAPSSDGPGGRRPKGLVSAMRLGGVARSDAEEVVVSLHGRTLAVRGVDGTEIAAGEILGATVLSGAAAAARRADVVVEVAGDGAVRLWLPEAPDASRRWRVALAGVVLAVVPLCLLHLSNECTINY